MKFTELELHEDVLKSIETSGFTECTPVQEASIPHILNGKDVAGLAQTGTGKTAAFLLPLINRVLISRDDTPSRYPKFENWKPSNFILVLVPTRELAIQVSENVEKFGGDLKSVTIYGGASYEKQKQALENGVQFVVATPGRLIDLFKEHVLDLSQVQAVVFDEADRMFDMGFKDDMKFILRRIPKQRQFLVYSATLNFDVLNTAYEFGANPVEVDVSRDAATADNVEDEIFHVGQGEKPAHLLSILKKYDAQQVIIFSNFKNNVDRIAQFLSKNNFPAVGISSLLTQVQRQKVMKSFTSQESNKNILVATDVAARGLDIKGVDLVVNFELPDDAENYVHRIGRTGRAGAKGKATSLVSDRDVEALARIEAYLDRKVNSGWLEDSEIVKEFEEFPPERDRRQSFRHGGKSPSPRYKKGRSSSEGYKKGAKYHSNKDQDDKSGDRRRNKRRRRPDKRSQESSPDNRHRDRMTGRHRGQQEEKQDSTENKKYNQKNRPQNRRKHNRSYRPDNKPSRPAPQTFGKKVSSFIKKLFS